MYKYKSNTQIINHLQNAYNFYLQKRNIIDKEIAKTKDITEITYFKKVANHYTEYMILIKSFIEYAKGYDVWTTL